MKSILALALIVAATSAAPIESTVEIVGLNGDCQGFTFPRTDCAQGLVCIKNSRANTDMPGKCMDPATVTSDDPFLSNVDEPCGGFANFRCEEGLVCIYADEDPYIDHPSGVCQDPAAPEPIPEPEYPLIANLNETCGGFANFQCAEGLECVYADESPFIDHPSGTCQKPTAPATNPDHPFIANLNETCGGIADFQCAEGLVCIYAEESPYIDHPSGTCQKPTTTVAPTKRNLIAGLNETCGGFADFQCAEGLECVYAEESPFIDHPSGTCQKPAAVPAPGLLGGTCGGIAGFQCAKGLRCRWLDAPNVSDRSGVCVLA
ncbi:hypothetical protein HDV05_006464 [Chytridiales sp. JEL 0842]|nr:hypothetical protein HDV05_006464 [Chytridiales sp. JEL 0842]